MQQVMKVYVFVGLLSTLYAPCNGLSVRQETGGSQTRLQHLLKRNPKRSKAPTIQEFPPSSGPTSSPSRAPTSLAPTPDSSAWPLCDSLPNVHHTDVSGIEESICGRDAIPPSNNVDFDTKFPLETINPTCCGGLAGDATPLCDVQYVLGEVSAYWPDGSRDSCVGTVIDVSNTLIGQDARYTYVLTSAECVYNFDQATFPRVTAFWPGDGAVNSGGYTTFTSTKGIVNKHFQVTGPNSVAQGSNYGYLLFPTGLLQDGSPDPSFTGPQSLQGYLSNLGAQAPTVEFARQDVNSPDARVEVFGWKNGYGQTLPDYESVMSHTNGVLNGFTFGSSSAFHDFYQVSFRYEFDELRQHTSRGYPAFKSYRASGQPLVISTILTGITGTESDGSTRVQGVRFAAFGEYILATFSAVDTPSTFEDLVDTDVVPVQGSDFVGYVGTPHCQP